MNSDEYLRKIDQDLLDAESIAQLRALATDPVHPVPDAAAILWYYYGREGLEDEAWQWRDLAEDMESELMERFRYEEAEREIEED